MDVPKKEKIMRKNKKNTKTLLLVEEINNKKKWHNLNLKNMINIPIFTEDNSVIECTILKGYVMCCEILR